MPTKIQDIRLLRENVSARFSKAIGTGGDARIKGAVAEKAGGEPSLCYVVLSNPLGDDPSL